MSILSWYILIGFFVSLAAIVGREVHKFRLRRQVAPAEIVADPETPIPPARRRQLDPKTVAGRIMLSTLWRFDTPDLVLTCWNDPANPERIIVRASHWLFPFSGDYESCIADIESYLRDDTRHPGVPFAATLDHAYSFVHLPERGRDMVIASVWGGREYHHQVYFLTESGRISLYEGEAELDFRGLLGHAQLRYRRALISMFLEGDLDAAEKLFESLVANRQYMGFAHLWLGHLSRQDGRHEDARIYNAFAHEFVPDNLQTLLETSELHGGSNEQDIAEYLLSRLLGGDDGQPETAFLLADSLLAFGRVSMARRLCEGVVDRYADHQQARLLLDLIRQRERGAQT